MKEVFVFYGYKEYPAVSFTFGQIRESLSYYHKDHTYDNVIPFGFSANGDDICFDYRKNQADPEIVIMFHDDFVIDEGGKEKMALNFIAKNFDDFMEMLHEYEDSE